MVSDDKEDAEEAFFLEQEFSGLYDNDFWEAIECYLNLPKNDNPEQNPLDYEYIREHQQADEMVIDRQEKYQEQYFYKKLDDDINPILCHVKPGKSKTSQWRIALPEQMLQETVNGFRTIMGHP